MRSVIASGIVAAVALAVAGSALAESGASRVQIDVTLLDGKIVVAPKSVAAGPVMLVVVNKGRRGHALAISGSGGGAKRTVTLKSGATAKLSLTASAGPYKLWDPVGGSLSKAVVLTAHAAPATSNGTSSGGAAVTRPSSGGSLSNNGTTTCEPGQNSDMPDPSQITACAPGQTN